MLLTQALQTFLNSGIPLYFDYLSQKVILAFWCNPWIDARRTGDESKLEITYRVTMAYTRYS